MATEITLSGYECNMIINAMSAYADASDKRANSNDRESLYVKLDGVLPDSTEFTTVTITVS